MNISGRLPRNVLVEIGDKNFFNGQVLIKSAVGDGRMVHTVSHDLYAHDIYFMGRNTHDIFDRTTHERLNNYSDIFLGTEI